MPNCNKGGMECQFLPVADVFSSIQCGFPKDQLRVDGLVLRICRNVVIHAVAVHDMGLDIIGEIKVENMFYTFLVRTVFNGYEKFNSVVQIARHPVGGR